MCFLFLCLFGCDNAPQTSEAQFRQFKQVFEPSGIQWVPGAGLVIIEDESDLTPRLFQFDSRLRIRSSREITGLPRVSDLEGITLSPEGVIYAITSHSARSDGKRDPGREHLLAFSLTGANATAVQKADANVRESLLLAYPELKTAMGNAASENQPFNIEALAYHQSMASMFIGLRSPLIQGKALIARLDNPSAFVRGSPEALFAEQLIQLDLGGGGIRAMAYDAELQGYLIASRDELADEHNFSLWLWNGAQETQRLEVNSLSNLSKLEGIAQISVDKKRRVMLVFDDGNSDKDRAGHYAIVDYSLIGPYSR